jgi:hypothetical protein
MIPDLAANAAWKFAPTCLHARLKNVDKSLKRQAEHHTDVMPALRIQLLGWTMNHIKSVDLQTALRELDDWHEPRGEELQRRFRRFAVRGEALLWPADVSSQPVAPATAQIRNISRCGIGMLCSEPASPGKHWRLQIIDSDLMVASVAAFCRFCRPVTDGAFLIGAEFGIEAAIMRTLGVSAKELTEGDEAETQPIDGEFIDPETLLR